MPEIPDDLIPLAQVLKERKPTRTWWDNQFARGTITPYRIPGERGLWLSKAAVEVILRPQPVDKTKSEEDAG